VGKKAIKPPAPGVWDDLIARIERLEHRVKALEDAARAFAVVYAIPRIPDPPEEPDERRD
jgi:hypothetical protein